jgi:hypothetical protein
VHSGYPDMEAVVGDMVFLYDWRSASVNKTFLDILDLTATRATTDPRDRVFALLSHPSARLESSVDASVELVTEPDYTKNVPDVYVDVARNHIIATRSLDVLSYIRYNRSPGIPSWVPDWRKIHNAHCSLSDEGFAAAGEGSSRYCSRHSVISTDTAGNKSVRCSQGRELLLKASVIGNVIWRSFYSSQDRSGESDHRWVETTWQSLQKVLLEECFITHTAAALVPKYRDALTCGGLHFQYSNTFQPRHYSADFAAFWFKLWGDDPEAEFVAAPDNHEWIGHGSSAFWEAVWYAWDGRRLFCTDTGYIGLGPETLEKGDEVCILQGGRVPYILYGGRGSAAHSKRNLVGECYVSGAMHGELVEGDGIGEVQWEERVLV